MIKLTACYNRKVPGPEPYSSESAGASIEMELDRSFESAIPEQLDQLWATLKAAVDQRLAVPANGHAPASGNGAHHAPVNGNGRAPANAAPHGNGHTPSNGQRAGPQPAAAYVPAARQQMQSNGYAYKDPAAPATKKQLSFLFSVGRRERGMSPNDVRTWVQGELSCDVERLTRQQAGALIDALQAQSA